MDWLWILQIVFYIVAILFFITMIIAGFIFIRRTIKTSNAIKRVVTSSEFGELIMKVKDGVTPLLTMINRP